MRMETVRSDITKFEHSAALSLNDILGTVQDLSDDIRRECGHAIEDCQPEDLSELTSKLIWLCNLSAKIADRHAGPCPARAVGAGCRISSPRCRSRPAHISRLRPGCASCRPRWTSWSRTHRGSRKLCTGYSG